MSVPGSSLKTFLSQGIVGSICGRGVFSSKNSGRLIATFEPRRRRIFAVNVLGWRYEYRFRSLVSAQ